MSEPWSPRDTSPVATGPAVADTPLSAAPPGVHAAGRMHTRGVLIVVVAVLCLVPDATLIRLTDAGDARIIFWRTLFVAASMTGLVALRYRARTVTAARAIGRPGLLIAVLWGSVSILFVYAVNHTAVANALVIIATAPLFAALFTRLLIGEAVHTRTVVAMVIAVGGVAITFASALRIGGLEGNIAALCLAAIVGASLTTIRRSGLDGTDMLPAMALSGLFAAAVALPFAWPVQIALRDVLLIATMGFILVPAAQALLITGTRYLSSPEVALLMLIETVLGPLVAWPVIGEAPPALAVVGSVIVIGAIAAHSLAARRAEAVASP